MFAPNKPQNAWNHETFALQERFSNQCLKHRKGKHERGTEMLERRSLRVTWAQTSGEGDSDAQAIPGVSTASPTERFGANDRDVKNVFFLI